MSGVTVNVADFDVAICGAGPAGMALAAMLARRGMAPARIALIDGKSLGQAITDPRSIALSYGSRVLLEEIGAWPLPATPIHQIHVSRRGRFGRSMMDRDDHKLPALGYVTRYGELVSALAAACERAGVAIIRPARVTGIDESDGGVTLHLDDGRALGAALAVQAEGGVFGQQDQRALQRDYQQSAIIARVAASAPIAHRAYERFTDDGPLALLPQDGADGLQYALVWCVRQQSAAGLLALGDDEFLARLGDAFGGRLGRFTRASSRAAYPLGLNAEPRATRRTVAIGNAAQTLHPVAGQGLNLGLRDAAVLARLLAREAGPEQLLAFGAARQADRKITVGMTDAMARVFANTGPAQTLLGLSLGMLDAVLPARLLLAELMMFGRR
ncbi:MAG: FAD-dependent monooxygenase [Pseudomonadota bacterium]